VQLPEELVAGVRTSPWLNTIALPMVEERFGIKWHNEPLLEIDDEEIGRPS
jgi:hypothetical protein